LDQARRPIEHVPDRELIGQTKNLLRTNCALSQSTVSKTQIRERGDPELKHSFYKHQQARPQNMLGGRRIKWVEAETNEPINKRKHQGRKETIEEQAKSGTVSSFHC